VIVGSIAVVFYFSNLFIYLLFNDPFGISGDTVISAQLIGNNMQEISWLNFKHYRGIYLGELGKTT